METIACAAELADVVDPTTPIETTLANIAAVRGVAVQELTVCILGRHEADLVRRIRDAGSRIKFLLDGDVAGAIMAANPDTDIDPMVGVGGTPEGVLAACALKCFGGAFYRADFTHATTTSAAVPSTPVYVVEAVLILSDMVRSDKVFVAATGVPTARCCAACTTRPTARRPTRSRCALYPVPSG
jgi:fructose-1,6-bisphosphatase II